MRLGLTEARYGRPGLALYPGPTPPGYEASSSHGIDIVYLHCVTVIHPG